MITFEQKNQVPGCTLNKCRSHDRGDLTMTCDEVCEGCGWTEDEMYRRKYDIRAGKMQTNPKGLRTLYVIGNQHKKL